MLSVSLSLLGFFFIRWLGRTGEPQPTYTEQELNEMVRLNLITVEKMRWQLKYQKSKERLATIRGISGLGFLVSVVILVAIFLLHWNYPSTFDPSYLPEDFISPADAATVIADDIANKAVEQTNTFNYGTPDEYIGQDAVFDQEIADDAYSKAFPGAYADAYIDAYKETYPNTDPETIAAITAGANACAANVISPDESVIPTNTDNGDIVATFKEAYIAAVPDADPADVLAAADDYNGEDIKSPNKNWINNIAEMMFAFSLIGFFVFGAVGFLALVKDEWGEY